MKKNNLLMPAEWCEHKGTIVVWPSNKDTWRKFLEPARECMAKLIALISNYEEVYVSINDADSKNLIIDEIIKYKCIEKKINILDIPNNDCWSRDFGPNYVKNDQNEIYINDWRYNAWGGKYPPWYDDANFTKRFANYIGITNINSIPMVLEGGSIDVNGNGIVMTTESCLLNKNRNPNLNKNDIEKKLGKYLGARDIIWLKEGIIGDDTDGHIDDFCRFIKKDVIVCCNEKNVGDENYNILKNNITSLEKHYIIDKNNINILSLPMPKSRIVEGIRLPLSYANFYFVNNALLVPIFGDKNDDIAIDILRKNLPDRQVIGVYSLPLLFGLGGIHCLTQQIL